MSRAIIAISFMWPFVVATVGGWLVAATGRFDLFMGGIVALSLAGAPGVMAGIHRLLPRHWPDAGRALLTLGLAILLVGIELLAAKIVFTVVFVWSGGLSWA